MPLINVVRGFTHTTEAGKLRYEPGEYDVDEATAEDWFVKAHLEGFVDPMPARGSTQYAQAMLNTEQAVRRAQPVGPPTQPPAPLPPDVVMAASRTGLVSEDAHYFAGKPQVDKPLPGIEETGPRVSFLGAAPQS
jgi:hypothetical protein